MVFGDIGTSPLYALRESFAHVSHLTISPDNVLGILSLIFWTMTLVISVKYMMFIMRADNRGQGGILSLMALALGNDADTNLSRRRLLYITLGLFGTALLFGDSIITPAISVLSAVEGLTVLAPHLSHFIIPMTLAIITLLFMAQRFGTARIGSIFGPIILLWFLTLSVLGIYQIFLNPDVLFALNPWYAVMFFFNNGQFGFLVLGSVFLVVTGGEALYADMGHFGKSPIRRAWFIVVMPSLLLNYFGQGSLLLSRPEAISNPFYLMAPSWALGYLIVLSTLATVIASQALISGTFAITWQAIQLGFLPRIPIKHTSSSEIGQIYIPFINSVLLVGVILLVLNFKSSSNLAGAYGIAVAGTMAITTILAYIVARHHWGWARWQAFGLFGFLFLIDFSFLSANTIKILEGGWVPLAVAVVIYMLLTTWKKGRKVLAKKLKTRSMPMDVFIEKIKKDPPIIVPGAAIYMSSDPWGVPVPMLHNLKHYKVLHQKVAVLTISTVEIPSIPTLERVQIEVLAPGFYRILARYGYMETPKIKHILEACRREGIEFHIMDTTFVLGRETILPGGHPEMSLWREKLFAIMTKNAQRPTAFFKIPPNQVVEVGIQVEV